MNEQPVQRMLDLHIRLSAAKTPADRTAIQRQIDATDRQIDPFVCQLYGSTDEGIAIVEEAGTRAQAREAARHGASGGGQSASVVVYWLGWPIARTRKKGRWR